MKIVILLILTVSFIFCLSCSDVQQEPSGTGPAETAEKPEYPDQESWDSTILLSKEGKKVAEVWSAYIAVYNKKNQTLLKDSIHVDFYDREGNHNSVLTADEGIVENQTRNLRAIGNVVVVSAKGEVLESEELLWDNRQQKIISEVPVKLTTQTDTLFGDSFVSDPDLIHYEIRNTRGSSKRIVPLEK